MQAEIEAAARAICSTFYGTTWDNTSGFRRHLCVDMASAALLAAERVRAEAGMVTVPRDVIAFLYGEAPLDGVWFGNRHPKYPGMFWWRSYLRHAAAAAKETGDE